MCNIDSSFTAYILLASVCGLVKESKKGMKCLCVCGGVLGLGCRGVCLCVCCHCFQDRDKTGNTESSPVNLLVKAESDS